MIKVTKENSNELIKGWLRPILIVVPYIIITGILQYFSFVILGIDPTDINQVLSPLQNLLISISTLIGTFIIVSVFRYNVDKSDILSLGFDKNHILRDLLLGICVGFTLISLIFFILFFFKQIQIEGVDLDALNLFYCVLLFITISIAEELFFRGYVLNNLMLSFKPWLALLLSASFFAIFHMLNQ